MTRKTLTQSQNLDLGSMWNRLIKQTVARFARGNISAQNARVQLQEEREAEHARAVKIAARMAKRAKARAAR